MATGHLPQSSARPALLLKCYKTSFKISMKFFVTSPRQWLVRRGKVEGRGGGAWLRGVVEGSGGGAWRRGVVEG